LEENSLSIRVCTGGRNEKSFCWIAKAPDCRKTQKLLYLFIVFSLGIVINLKMLISTPGGRVPRARLQPLPSLRSVQGLQLALFPQESPPYAPINGVRYKIKEEMDKMKNEINNHEQLEVLIIEQVIPQGSLVNILDAAIDFSFPFKEYK
jgi:hypothetical protein